jgi:osmotically-inducible protein OsmY
MDYQKGLISVLFALAVALSAGCQAQRQQTGQYLGDSYITTKVDSALLADPMVSGMDINVETHDGTVQLSGFVDSPKQKRRAEELARSVEGVRSVRNDIRMK